MVTWIFPEVTTRFYERAPGAETALMSLQADGDLRLQPPLRTQPRLAEPVPRIGLGIQSRHAGKD